MKMHHTRLAWALVIGLGLAPRLASAQSPADCNANLLDESISRSTDTAVAGQTVTFTVTAVDRTRLPPGCATGDPTCQIGCDVLDVTADFCCPAVNGQPATPPNALCTNLVTMQDIPATDAVAVFGPFPCVMPDVGPGSATAAVTGNGLLDDGFQSPFQIDKTIAVSIVTTTTTTSTSTSTSTTTSSSSTTSSTSTTTSSTTSSTTSTSTTTSSTTSTSTSTSTTTSSTTTTSLPALCLTRTPGFWGNHGFLITGDDPRSLDLLPLDVCGTTLDNTAAGNDTSTTEAICSVGTDGKILGPQETQLIRQCTAALLNVAATTTLGGSCEGVFLGLDELLTNCCGPDSICTGTPIAGLSIGDCIDQVTAFNETELSGVPFGFNPGPAKSGPCRASKGNKIVVSPTP